MTAGLPFAARTIQSWITRTALEDPVPFRHAGNSGAQTKGKHGSNLSSKLALLCLVFTRLMQAQMN
jgi:hypothetical protein